MYVKLQSNVPCQEPAVIGAGHESVIADNSHFAVMSIIHKISPVPKAMNARKRRRAVESGVVLTSSSYKKQLLDKTKANKPTKYLDIHMKLPRVYRLNNFDV